MLALLLAAATALPPAPPPAPPPELWHGTRVGMSPAQVAALFPHGRAPTPYTLGFPPVPNAVEGGGAAGYAVDEEVFGHPAVATYYFRGGGLLETVVDIQNLRLRHTRDNVEIARDVQAGLANYYGPPKVCVDTDKRGLARLDCRWVGQAVQIGLSYVDYGGLGPALTVAVRPLPPKQKITGAVFSRHGSH